MNPEVIPAKIALSYGGVEVIFNILTAFVLGTVVAYLYQKTHKGLSYSQGFVFSLILLAMITAVVMMVIGNNLAKAFTLVGALSIIRFRTAVKDPRDIAYVFFALVIGMACGTSNFYTAAVAVILIGLVIVLLTKLNFGSITKHEYILRFLQNADRSDEAFKDVFLGYLHSSILLNLNSIDSGRLLELSYNIKFKDNSKLSEFVKELSATEGVENVGIISAKSDVDY